MCTLHTAHALALATHFFCVCDAKFNKFCGLFSLVLVEFQWKNMVIYFCWILWKMFFLHKNEWKISGCVVFSLISETIFRWAWANMLRHTTVFYQIALTNVVFICGDTKNVRCVSIFLLIVLSILHAKWLFLAMFQSFLRKRTHTLIEILYVNLF